MPTYNVEVMYTGIIGETIEADTQEEAEFQARDIATMEVPSEADVVEISVF